MTSSIDSFVYTYSVETELYYYQSLTADGNPLGHWLVYKDLVDFQGTEEHYIPAPVFDDRFVLGTPPWRKP